MTVHGINLTSEAIGNFCNKWRIRELCVFGSILRDDFRPDSDVDFLAEFADDEEWDLSDHCDMIEELAGIIGRRVDLLDRGTVERDENWLFKINVLSSTERLLLRA